MNLWEFLPLLNHKTILQETSVELLLVLDLPQRLFKVPNRNLLHKVSDLFINYIILEEIFDYIFTFLGRLQ
jgi:hypothetical protein